MFKYAISNIALNAFDHTKQLQVLPALGFQGIEVAPSRIWKDTWYNLTNTDVQNYRNAVESAGLKIIGLHSLFFDHPELGLFKDIEMRKKSLDFLYHLSSVCRDLGGKTLIWGNGRRRKKITEIEAFNEATEFMSQLCHRVEGHNTSFCFEPLGPSDTDFLNSAKDTLKLAETLGHPAIKVQLDAKALVQNNEATFEIFDKTAHKLVHFHANEPDLGILDNSGSIPHSKFSKYLNKVGYTGYVSIEQRLLDPKKVIKNIERSAKVLRMAYK